MLAGRMKRRWSTAYRSYGLRIRCRSITPLVRVQRGAVAISSQRKIAISKNVSYLVIDVYRRPVGGALGVDNLDDLCTEVSVHRGKKCSRLETVLDDGGCKCHGFGICIMVLVDCITTRNQDLLCENQ